MTVSLISVIFLGAAIVINTITILLLAGRIEKIEKEISKNE